ncbi:DUF6463 family protein [Amycolatopsis cihanbeyliensis]|uniref:Uncharacterized protein n=1 Tax=Amycolatopsis cihanbeyliensis TaxID=1128664 RepID=A0A542DGK9_AMYCI|nr:DUF6463 family protein [Amycolatopsis cihanbeyliensis]TQJ02206.1 hypothetical protein FB471_1926 [Amycolatopsis cihanbeyliensis]
MFPRSSGKQLQVLGFLHAGVGAVRHGKPLAEIARAKVVGAVPDEGERATAFWFMVAAPMLWLGGRLLCTAEETGDLRAQRVAGRLLVVIGAVGAAARPVSGFWALAAIGLEALRRGKRT